MNNWLDVYGLLVFQNKKNKFLFATRAYRNIDRVLFIDETRGLREYAGEGKYSEFNHDEWIPITKDEYEMIKFSYGEILVIRNAINLNKSLKKLNLVKD